MVSLVVGVVERNMNPYYVRGPEPQVLISPFLILHPPLSHPNSLQLCKAGYPMELPCTLAHAIPALWGTLPLPLGESLLFLQGPVLAFPQ